MLKFKENGFTLLELLAVMSVIAIITVTALPNLTSSQTVALDAASRKVEGDIRYAQSLATTTGDEYGFRTIDDGNDTTYEVYEVASDDVVESPYDHQPMQEDLDESFPGIVFQNNESYDITFGSQGMPNHVDGDGSLEIENDDGEIKTISINDAGLITVE